MYYLFIVYLFIKININVLFKYETIIKKIF